MALIIEGGVSASLMGVGAEAANAAEVQVKPAATGGFGVTVIGHYRAATRLSLVASQVAATQAVGRLVHLRNPGGGLLVVPTRFRISWFQTASWTAQARFELGLVKAWTGNLDNASAGTPVVVAKDVPGSPGASQPQARAQLNFANAGSPNGMTGGTAPVFEGNVATPAHFLARIDLVGQLTLPDGTTGLPPRVDTELLDDVNGTHPLVLGAGESMILLFIGPTTGVAHGSEISWDLSWFEAKEF
jgi:hypothetical protein